MVDVRIVSETSPEANRQTIGKHHILSQAYALTKNYHESISFNLKVIPRFSRFKCKITLLYIDMGNGNFICRVVSHKN